MSTIQTLAVKGIKNFFSLKPKRDKSITTDQAKLGLLFIYLTQLSDFTSTVIGLSVGAAEQNPLMANTIELGGYPGFFLTKVVLAGTFLAWFTWKRRYAPWVVGGLYAAITIWNSIIIFIATN